MNQHSANDLVRIAMVGCGRMGNLHAERVRIDGRAVVAAACDPDPAAADMLRRQLAPEAVVFADLQSILAAGTVDAAVICSPTKLHFEHVSACLERGLHVLCEKPLATTREEILRLIARARSTGRHLMIAYQRRFLPIYRTLRREIQSCRWGEIRAIHSFNTENWQSTIAGTWRDDPEVNPGGFIGDAGSHKIDIVFYLTGLMPSRVFARTKNCGSRVNVTTGVVAVLDGNVPLSIDFIGNANHFSESLHLTCANGDLVVRGETLSVARNESVEQVTDLEPESNPISAFLDLVRNGSENPVPPECALPVFDFTEAALLSGRTGAEVSLIQPTHCAGEGADEVGG